ncbi:MAG: hypothetical protein AAF942_12360 [Pseudomonadota bacterium]
MEISLFLPSPPSATDADAAGAAVDRRSTAEGRKNAVLTQGAIPFGQAVEGATPESRSGPDGSGRGRIIDITV